MIPLLNADNKDTANVFTKLVFHFILNLQSNQVPKVSSLISFMQHKNVFKSEDVIHLESCLQQWLKEDQKVEVFSFNCLPIVQLKVKIFIKNISFIKIVHN